MTSSDQEPLRVYLRRRMDELDVRSIRELARRAGVGVQTASRLLNAEGVPDELTLRRVADALGLPLQQIRAHAGRPVGERTAFRLPAEADQLNDRQRSVIIAMVHVLLDSSSERDEPVAYCDAPRLVGRLRDPDGPDPDASS